MTQPQFVLRGFSSEPSACCGCSVEQPTGRTLYVAVGLSDGSLQLWHIGTYRPVAKSAGSVFSGTSPVLTLKQLPVSVPDSGAIMVAESKMHEYAFMKVTLSSAEQHLAPELVPLFKATPPANSTSPSFCQFDTTCAAEDHCSALLVRSTAESSLGITTFSLPPSASQSGRLDENTVTGPQALQLGCAMFASFLSHGQRLLAGFESSHLVLWALDNKASNWASFLDSIQLQVFLDKTDDDGDLCPTCADVCDSSVGNNNSEKPAFAIIGTTCNLLFKIVFNKELDTLNESPPLAVKMPAKGMTAVRLRPDRKLAAIGFADGSICLVSPKSMSLLGTLTNHRLTPGVPGSKTISALAFIVPSKQSWLMAASCRDRTLSIWDIYNKQQ